MTKSFNLSQVVDSTGATNVGYTAPFTVAVARTQSSKNAESVSVLDFGAVGDGVTDDTTAIQAALNASLHVVVPAGKTPLISSAVTMQSHGRLQFLGGLGNTNGSYPASYLIKKSTMSTNALVLNDCCVVDGGGLICQTGNTGDGVTVQGNNVKVRDFLVSAAGGVGVRVGTSGGANVNSFELDHVTSQYNGSHGFMIHDGTSALGANANAGTLIQCFSQHNTGDGYHLGHCFWVTVLNCLAEANTGYGINLSGTANNTYPECRWATVIGGDYNEGNTAGQLYDQSYCSTFINPDKSNIPTNIGNGLQGSALRNVITSLGNSQLNGLVVNTAAGTYPLTGAAGYSAGATYPIQASQYTASNNGDGPGYGYFVSTDGVTWSQAGGTTVVQSATGVYQWNVSLLKGGTLSTYLALNVNANCFIPAVDNSLSLGLSGYRWSVVYAATGTINTSDANQKQQGRALSDAEKAVAVKVKAGLKAFKWNDAVEKKGDNARWHFGVYAQEVQAAFASEGLDAAKYGLFCSDKMEDGTDRLGVRYEELLAFVLAAL